MRPFSESNLLNSVLVGFARPAELTLSYDNCTEVRSPKGIVYTSERLSILQSLFSLDYPKYEYVTSPIDHFSRYAVAY